MKERHDAREQATHRVIRVWRLYALYNPRTKTNRGTASACVHHYFFFFFFFLLYVYTYTRLPPLLLFFLPFLFYVLKFFVFVFFFFAMQRVQSTLDLEKDIRLAGCDVERCSHEPCVCAQIAFFFYLPFFFLWINKNLQLIKYKMEKHIQADIFFVFVHSFKALTVLFKL